MFTKEELEFIKQVLLSTPLQGNMQSLPAVMNRIVGLVKKIDEELNGRQHAERPV
jgi:hypothetical protein